MGVKSQVVLFYLLFLIIAGIVAYANPNAPTSVVMGQNNRRNDSGGNGGTNVTAMAGNVTELAIVGFTVSESWQGYYGNITGTIHLDNANNQSLYLWNWSTPDGEVYASNISTVNWSSVQCLNMTGNGTTEGINGSLMNTMFGIAQADPDTFQITFNETYSGTLLIGSRTLDVTNSRCKSTRLYNGSGYHSTDWVEVLLTDNSTRGLIFASIMQNDANAFDNTSRDFEMIVADDGHNGNTSTTTYYFFVELT